VKVRFESDLPNEWTTVAVSWWSNADSDLAVVSIEPRPGSRPVIPARFGRISDQAAVLTAHAVGFPRWKMRKYTNTTHTGKHFRDACHVVGSVAVLSNWREGTLEISVSSGPVPSRQGQSAWEGMSGAALWIADRIVGVVARHYNADGTNRLAAVRIDRAFDRLSGTEAIELRKLIPAQLPDVVPAAPEKLVSNAHQALLSDIAPLRLLDREPELDELVAFCAGDAPYAWWQGAPWAGKSALLSWFAMRPPAGVDVVSFFVTSRFAGQSDSEAFTDALIEQLAALADEPLQPVLEARARRGHLLRLLQLAADRCAEAGRRLLLIVDGLDEDTSKTAGMDRRSIASLLPHRLPSTVRVLMASRPHPGLPDDVRADHPLRSLTPHPLAPSPHACQVESVATDELNRLLQGPSLGRSVLGLITASGGGLTGADLEELTGHPPYELDALLGGLFGRSIGNRTHTDVSASRPVERVYVFAHETLYSAAERQFGAGLKTYRARLHEWAQHYQLRRWPADTPTYLFRGYPRLLAAIGDTDRLCALVTDRARHNRMLDILDGDSLAFVELSIATSLLAREPTPDLTTLLLVALTHDELAERNHRLPLALPAVWAALGQQTRAIALANGIDDLSQRAQALCQLVSVLADGRDDEVAANLAAAAEATADDITDPYQRGLSLSSVAVALAGSGFYDQAERIARQVGPFDHGRALSSVAVAFGRGGHCARAKRVIDEFLDRRDRTQLTVSVATALAGAGFGDHAERLACGLAPPDCVRALGSAAIALAARGDHARPVELTVVAEAVAREIPERVSQSLVLGDLAVALMEVGLSGCAERLARQITLARPRVHALCRVAVAFIARGERDRGIDILRSAEKTAVKINHHDVRDQAFKEIVEATAGAGLHEHAQRLADEIRSPGDRLRALGAVAIALANGGHYVEAQRLARQISSHGDASALVSLARVLGAAGFHARAERLADELGPADRVRVLSAVALELANTGDHDRATELMAVAEAIALRIGDPARSAAALSEVAVALASTGDATAVERLTQPITNPRRKAAAIERAIEVLARRDTAVSTPSAAGLSPSLDSRAATLARMAAAASSGDDRHRVLELADSAATAARDIAHLQARVQVYLDLLTVVAGDGDRTVAFAEAAESAAHEITSPEDRATTLSTLALALAGAGFPDRAARIAVEAEASVRRPGSRNANGRALAAVVAGLAGAGDLDRSRRLADAIEEPSARANALAVVATRLAVTGDLDQALQLAEATVEPAARATALAAVAARLAAVGSHEQAVALVATTERIVRDMPDLQTRALVLAELAVAQAASGDRDVAVDLALAAESAACGTDKFSPDRSTTTRVLVALTLARARRRRGGGSTGGTELAIRDMTRPYDRAEHLAAALDTPTARADALTAVAVELARLGLRDRAIELAATADLIVHEVTGSNERAHALGNFVSRLTELCEDPGPVHPLGVNGPTLRRILVQVLGTRTWHSAIPAVSRVDLPALQRFCDVLLDGAGSVPSIKDAPDRLSGAATVSSALTLVTMDIFDSHDKDRRGASDH
jgi:hypothetical protein